MLIAKSKEMGGQTEIYTGSCHCQAVKFAVVCKPLHSAADETIVDCACSICLGVSSHSDLARFIAHDSERRPMALPTTQPSHLSSLGTFQSPQVAGWECRAVRFRCRGEYTLHVPDVRVSCV